MNFKTIEKKYDSFIAELDLDDLKNYVNNLTHDYLISISENDIVKVKQITNNFKKLINIREDVNIERYINYCIINNFNNIISSFSDSELNIDAVNLKESSLNKIKEETNVETELQVIIDFNIHLKALEKEKEYLEKNLSAEEILELYHYEDYKI